MMKNGPRHHADGGDHRFLLEYAQVMALGTLPMPISAEMLLGSTVQL